MINVYIDDRYYTITDSLYESLQQNNGIIMEVADDKLHKKWLNVKNSVKQAIKVIDKDQYENKKDEIDNALESLRKEYIDDIKNHSEKDYNSKGYKEDLEYIKGLVKELTQEVSQQADIVTVSPDSVNQAETIIQTQNDETPNENERSNDYNDSQADFNNSGIDISGKIYNSLEDALADKKLRAEIHNVEHSVSVIIKRIKYLIHSYVGVWGSDEQATKSKFLDEPNDNDKVTSDNTSTIKPTLKSINGSINEADNDANNNVKQYVDVKDTYKNSADLGRKVKSNLQLALGGFQIIPMFGKDNLESAGKALKYYAGSMPENNSRINAMIRTFIEYKTNPNRFGDEVDKYGKQFETMCNNFLHNTSYLLLVNNDKYYEQKLKAIRSDTLLRKYVTFSTRNPMHLLNANETVLSVTDIKNKILLLNLVVIPLFAKGREIFKELKPIYGYLKQLKG